MSTIRFRADQQSADWVAEAVGTSAGNRWCGCVSTEVDGVLGAGALFNGYLAGTSVFINLRVTNPRAIQRKFLMAVFATAFDYFGVPWLYATISSSNTKSQKLAEHAGFDLIARMDGGFTDGDIMLYAMHRSDCKYLGGLYAQERK